MLIKLALRDGKLKNKAGNSMKSVGLVPSLASLIGTPVLLLSHAVSSLRGRRKSCGYRSRASVNFFFF